MGRPKGVGPAHSVAEMREAFTAYSRQPFIDVLAKLTACQPTEKALSAFAEDHPDRWASAIRTFAQLAGYSEKLEITGNIAMEIRLLGDAQLLEKLYEINGKLVELGGGEYEELPPPPSEIREP